MSVRIVPSITEPVPALHEGTMRSPWSPRELQVLRERYRDGGSAACLPLLPHRTASAIYERARKLGLHGHKPHAAPRPSTPELDAAIARLYASQDMGKGVLKAFCARHKVGRQWVHIRACELGVAPVRSKQPNWTEAEDDLVEEHAHRSLDYIQRRLVAAGHPRRTEAAIGIRRKRLTAGPRQARIDAGVYAGNDVAAAMGIDPHSVARWVERHGLRAKATAQRPDGRIVRRAIARGDLRDWMLSNCHLWDHRKCDQIWLVDLLSDGSRKIQAAGRETA